MKTRVLGATILAALIVLSGCGQRGPLYLPKPVEPVQQGADGAARDAARPQR
ncbi:MAG TPA: lipoprotein [Quisquiliibacterium sp.]|nr:lipoprotein [Quisquiliibacterium sp.]HPA90519.1 lipoprotein [Quisquiliibacterium sp.]HQD81476.1 lipoprotein [Quisquiliibacterium sp.]HQN12768.1 lipoprotein [Quisquiliibacterium sp.]HQP66477.1 lipoprotein [Quisquiliibacterium sp.]